MNMNEVLANRALDLLEKPRGSYDIVSPNNHVNMAQSTNDSFPTSIKVCLCVKSRLHSILSPVHMTTPADRASRKLTTLNCCTFFVRQFLFD